jgi:hypothetical protein
MLTISKGTVKLGQTPLDVTGTVNMKPSPAQLDLKLRANNVSITEVARLAAASGMALPPGTTVNGTATADLQARGPADKLALSGTVTGREVQASGKDIPQPVQVKAVNLALTPDEIRSDNFPVVSGGTTVNTQFSLRSYASKTPLVDATLKAPQAELPAILAMAKAYGLTGTSRADRHSAGHACCRPPRSITSNEIMRARTQPSLNFNNVRYSWRYRPPVGQRGRFLNLQSLQRPGLHQHR